jgi:BirA family biotin operon repressor/biotin-[acetyl-CoA-carboxylase] ligase
MPEQALRWGAEALWQQLEPLLPGLSVEIVRHTSSTNSALLDRARIGSDPQRDSNDASATVRRSVESTAFGRRAVDLQPCLLVAEHQTDGRGRQGKVWQSAAGASLTFSLGLPLALVDWSGLSLAVGVALCEALDDLVPDPSSLRIGLKWPNDLWLMGSPYEGRKLGGILIETVAAGTQRLAIIGVGLNVLTFTTDAVNSGFAALGELDANATAPSVLAQVAPPLVRAVKLFEREGFAAFEQRFAARDVLRGQTVRTTLPSVPEGIACGVSAQGALLVQTKDGLVSVASGEVSVRLSAPTSGAA